MRLLSIFFAGVDERFFRQITITEFFLNVAATPSDRLATEIGRIRTHIGDVASFVESLRHRHGLLDAEPQPSTGRLLQSRRDEWGTRLGPGRSIFPTFDNVVPLPHSRDNIHRVGFVVRSEILTILSGQLKSVRFGLVGSAQIGERLPIFLRNECPDLAFTLHHQAYGDRLDPAGRQSAGDFRPQQR